jgi:CubicO group peptidase (beta-lactamase class C family)
VTPVARSFLAQVSLALSLVVGCATRAPIASTPASTDRFHGLGAVTEAALKDSGAPGAVVAVVERERVVYLHAFGLADAESNAPMRPEMLFRIASLTKSFTGLAAAKLHHDGKLRLDGPIGDVVADLSPGLRDITTAQLLSHTAGIRDEGAKYGPRDPAALAAAARRLGGSDLYTTPGDVYSYSNLGFLLAGFVIESAAKKPYAEVVASEILQPLGMTRSTFDANMAMTYPFALGHAPRGEDKRSHVVRPFWENAEALSRGGMFSSASELGRFAAALMNDGVIDGKSAIPAEVVRMATAPRVRVPGERQGLQYGLGFRNDRYRGLRQVGHFGGGMGFGAVLRMIPERRLAVIVLANQTNALLNRVADAAFDAVIGTPTEADAAATPPVALTAEEARAFAGKYRNGDQVLDLTLRGDELMLSDEGELFPIRRTGVDEVVALGSDGRPILTFVTAVGPQTKQAYLFVFGRAFRRDSVAP